MKSTTAYACIWIATACAIIAGIIVTSSPHCLWALLIPACTSWDFD